MLSVFIFKSNARGTQYGIGTYIEELTNGLLMMPDIKVFIISYLSMNIRELLIERISERLCKINLPSPYTPYFNDEKFDLKYAAYIVNSISEIIQKEKKVIFQINHIDALPLIKKLKDKFSFPIVSIVHYSYWQPIFNGNKRKIRKLYINNSTTENEFVLFLEKELYHLSDKVISVTNYMKDFLNEYYNIDSEKIEVVHNGLDINKKILNKEEKSQVRKKLGFLKDDKIILFVGRIDDSKGIFNLLDAFVEVCNEMDNLRLVIVGDGKISECLQYAQYMKGKLCFTGYLNKQSLSDIYQIADLGILPSYFDHCPYSILEMAAYKVPLILSEINGLTEIFNSVQCEFLKPIIDSDGNIKINHSKLKEKLRLVCNKTKLEHYAENAYLNIKNNFNNINMSIKYKRIYNSFYH